ncbi:hypothetical protein BDR26DRAFT_937699 [Obelidium mucronatum]|nr:hypothetical protein BDR26DRAFT_937699 [Obelidium mucronatum]
MDKANATYRVLRKRPKEWRFVLRVCQLAFTLASFAGLSVGTFRANYKSSVLSTAGINFMAFTAIASGFLSFAWLVVYTNPASLGIPPHKHPRISRIELTFDILFSSLWFAASVNLAAKVSAACVPSAFGSCISWDLSLVFGYVCAASFVGMGFVGGNDLRENGWGFTASAERSGRAVEARGGWVQAKVLRRTKDGVEMLVDEFED